MTRPLASLRRWVRPANLYHYTHKLVSWNKLSELVIFGKLDELSKLDELEDFAELEDFYQAGNFYQYPSKLEQRKDPAHKAGSYLGVSI